MSEAITPDFCPYKGLQPYTEQDCAFFFGRTRDEQIIISNLYAAQLTVFYGASGVGKSSVLLAGSVPLLKQEPNVTVVVFRNWQDPNFFSQLKECTLAAAVSSTGKQIEVDPSLSLDEFLSQVTRSARGPLFFIFDQFEEYFLYNPPSARADEFESEFALAVNRRDINVNFLVSLREDGLSKLDRFQARIPTLLNNMLRLEHLDRDGARVAITEPLDVYNQRLKNGHAPVTIEPALVESVLDDLRGVKVTSEQTGQGGLQDSAAAAAGSEIETPLLQMVLTRLWDEERAQGSRVLRLQTFEKLGRAANIARTHLDLMMSRLTPAECDEAANILRYLVTPAGTKIAQEAGALASWTELPEAGIQTTLNRLSSQDMRILRTVQTPGMPSRYEIFHDVLARAILDWRGRYVAKQQQERIRREEQERSEKERQETERRRDHERNRLMRRAIVVLSTLLLIVIGVMVLALVQRHRANRADIQKELADRKAEKAKDDLEAEKKKQLEAAVHSRNAQLLAQRRKFDEAAEEYDEAIALDPSNSILYSNKGYALYRAKRYPEAIQVLKDLTVRDPGYAWGHYNLALAYWADHQTELAMQEAQEVLNNAPTFCETFRKDGTNYGWFIKSPEFAARCPDKKTQSADQSQQPN